MVLSATNTNQMQLSTKGISGGFDPTKMASMIASKMMSDLDPNNTGKVSKDQFVSAMTAKGLSSTDATKMYASIDTKGTGSITKSDIESAVKNGNLKPPSGGPRGAPSGAGGAGGPGGAGGAGQKGGSAATSTKYDKADLNQDGTVTSLEKMMYEIKHPSVGSSDNKTLTQNPGSNDLVNLKV